jgi:two-component system sensor histidine kinase/response regulator
MRRCNQTKGRPPTPLGPAPTANPGVAGDDRFQHIFHCSTDAIAIASLATGRYLDVNDEFVRMSGYPREQIIGTTPPQLGFWQGRDIHAELAERLERDGEVRNFEVVLKVRDGEMRTALISATLIDFDGERSMMRITRDVTRFIRAQDELSRVDRRLREVLADAPIVMTATDADGVVTLSQGAGLGLLKLAQDQLVGHSVFDIAPPDSPIARHWRDALGGSSQTAVEEFGGRVFEACYSPLHDAAGAISGAMGVATDITGRVRAEGEIRYKEAFYRSVIETSADTVLAMDTAIELRFVGGSGLRDLGYSAAEILHHGALEFIHPDNLAEQAMLTRRAFHNPGEIVRSEARVRARDGSWIPVEFAGQASLGPDGNPILVTTMRNITERKRRQEELRRSEQYYRSLIESSSDLIIAMNAAGTIVFAGGNGRHELGWDTAELVGQPAARFEHPDDIAEQTEVVGWVFANPGQRVRTKVRLRSKRGDAIPFEFAGAVITGPDDRPILLTTGRSIAERLRVEAELSAARDAALEALRVKSEFISSVSHEIRTPMNAILGMADVLSETPLSSEQRRNLEIITSNGNSLLELINTILDFARVESGRLALETQRFDLAEVVEHVGETFAARSREKGLELLVRIAPEVPAAVIGDPLRLRQVLLNLVGNAIKFTERGHVLVDVRPAVNSGADTGALHFSVTDTGIGIAPDILAEIFKPFTQADSSTTRRFGGTGLGLSIVSRLASLMGGRVWAQSEPGKGSTFHFTIRLRADAEKPAPIPEFKGRNIVVLDGHPLSRALLAEMLAPTGAAVVAPDSPERAFTEIDAAGARARAIDAIVVDSRIGGGNGLDIARQLARRFTPPPCIIMMTGADPLAAAMAQPRADGIDARVMKPVRRRDLYAALARAMRNPLQPERGEESAPPAPAPRVLDRELKILLADDSPDNCRLVQAYLKRTPYRLEFAENGEAAFRKFVGTGADLLLMDIRMPVLDGFGATEMIRRWEAANQRTRTPIIALTASAMPESVARARAAGCDMHISKPVKRATLLDAIASMIEPAVATAG